MARFWGRPLRGHVLGPHVTQPDCCAEDTRARPAIRPSPWQNRHPRPGSDQDVAQSNINQSEMAPIQPTGLGPSRMGAIAGVTPVATPPTGAHRRVHAAGPPPGSAHPRTSSSGYHQVVPRPQSQLSAHEERALARWVAELAEADQRRTDLRANFAAWVREVGPAAVAHGLGISRNAMNERLKSYEGTYQRRGTKGTSRPSI